jgi:hypothetical protein
VSCLLNAAGITFFILFLSAESHVKSLSRNLKKQETNFEIVRAEPNQANSSAILSKRMFISQYDGLPDSFAVAPPFLLQPTKAVTLVVYCTVKARLSWNHSKQAMANASLKS